MWGAEWQSGLNGVSSKSLTKYATTYMAEITPGAHKLCTYRIQLVLVSGFTRHLT